VQVTTHSATLSWGRSTSVVAGYRVYRSLQSGTGYALLTSNLVPGTSFVDTTVARGQTYFYVVTAVDAQWNQSAFSNEVFATIPTS
jgi:fibronectin type 3 domain-containing protein